MKKVNIKRKNVMKRKVKNEHGAIVVEATIAFSAFIFLIFIVYSIVDICYIQAKMGIALNESAIDMSQYSYLYYNSQGKFIKADFKTETKFSPGGQTIFLGRLNRFS